MMRMDNVPDIPTARLLLRPPPALRVFLRVVLPASVGLMDLLLLNQRGNMATGMRGEDLGHTVMWLLACRLLPIAAACTGTLLALRMLWSALRQRAQTQAVLCPLLAQPPVVPPAPLMPLLQTLQIDQRTLLIAHEFPVALCYGLFYPRLLFSTAALNGLSSQEVEAVLRHEQVHLRRRDPLRRLLLRSLTDALPLPALQDIAGAVSVAQELAADRAVLEAVGPEALSGALLKVGDALDALQEAPAEPGIQEQPLAIGAFSAIDARIDQILGAPIPGQLRSVSMALPLLVLALLASGPLFCLLLPLPALLFWAGGVLAAANWQRLRIFASFFLRRGSWPGLEKDQDRNRLE
jgi:Zn-dependent protease with chaperone function